MPSAVDRKVAIAEYKRRKVVGGVYAVTCVPTGERWVGSAPDLSTIKNRIWFTLNLGNAPWIALQAAWKKHGAGAFTFAEVDRLDGDLEPFAREVALKERLAHWRQALAAAAI
jgi:hypothetical protein